MPAFGLLACGKSSNSGIRSGCAVEYLSFLVSVTVVTVELTDASLVTIAREEDDGDAGAGIAITSALFSALRSMNENFLLSILTSFFN